MTPTGSLLVCALWMASLWSCSTSDQEGVSPFPARWTSSNKLGPGEVNAKVPSERFVTQNNSVVTGQVGASVVLHCKTSSATGGLVSWIRKRDYQLLTVGLQTHSSDERFTINYVHWDWQLHIRFVQPRDAGAYECQVSSHPPTSLFVHLEVVEAESEILGAPEKHVKLGSILRLVCIMHHTTEPLSYVFWYRGTEMINYESEEGTGSVVVESDDHTSVLMVTRASRHHSGNYTCAPSNAKPTSILVHILNEYPAAMQHGVSSCMSPPSLATVALVALLAQMTAALTLTLHLPLSSPRQHPGSTRTSLHKTEARTSAERWEESLRPSDAQGGPRGRGGTGNSLLATPTQCELS
ncbi:cell adhesion molecule DSCAML1-like isoform X2 [Penaeus indicus]|uniref:cell adhesion molecule DSCAML1-like isoform X2 n=1 Tax=Penaeus indicus TaxID=29960 RepID=UPI00300C3D53